MRKDKSKNSLKSLKIRYRLDFRYDTLPSSLYGPVSTIIHRKWVRKEKRKRVVSIRFKMDSGVPEFVVIQSKVFLL